MMTSWVFVRCAPTSGLVVLPLKLTSVQVGVAFAP
jgi:hypothetical protein